MNLRGERSNPTVQCTVLSELGTHTFRELSTRLSGSIRAREAGLMQRCKVSQKNPICPQIHRHLETRIIAAMPPPSKKKYPLSTKPGLEILSQPDHHSHQDTRVQPPTSPFTEDIHQEIVPLNRASKKQQGSPAYSRPVNQSLPKLELSTLIPCPSPFS